MAPFRFGGCLLLFHVVEPIILTMVQAMAEENQDLPDTLEYAGFWARCGAMLIDTLVLLLVTIPLTVVIYGAQVWHDKNVIMGSWDVIINWLFPVAFVILFWRFKGATPGKMITSMKVVDAKTGLIPGFSQSALRYVGYFVSVLPFMLGFFWIAIDKKKQGWHDKIAGTVVIRLKKTES